MCKCACSMAKFSIGQRVCFGVEHGTISAGPITFEDGGPRIGYLVLLDTRIEARGWYWTTVLVLEHNLKAVCPTCGK